MIKASENFEAVYLRHSDFKRIEKLPKERKDVAHLEADHSQTVWVYSQRFFNKHNSLLLAVGIGFDDLLSISKIHLYKYLVLHSLKNNEENLAKFVEVYKAKRGADAYPTLTDITKKDASNFMSHLSQRLSDLLRLCNMKVKNINGMKQIKAVFELPLHIDESVTDEFILENHAELGARRLTLKQTASLRQSGADLTSHHFMHEGKLYRSIMLREDSFMVQLNDSDTFNIDARTPDYETLLERHYQESMESCTNTAINNAIRAYKKLNKEGKKAFLQEQILIAKAKKDMYALNAAEELLGRL